MTTDDRLRRALRARADRVEPGHGSWAAIQSGVAAAQRRRRLRAAGVAGLAVAAVVAVALVAVPMIGDDPTSVETGPVATSPTTEATPPTSEAPADGPFEGIWPFTTREAAAAYEPGGGADDHEGFHGSAEVDYTDPEATALDFARTYLGFPDPVVEEGLEEGGPVPVDDRETSEAGGLTLRAQPDSPMTTRVGLRRDGDEGEPWYVTHAAADNIPEVRPTIDGTEATVTGRSTAFEGNILLEVRADGMVHGESLGGTFATGGSMGELGPFETTFSFDEPAEPAGAIVVYTDSARDGTVQEATVMRVHFDDESTGSQDADDVDAGGPCSSRGPEPGPGEMAVDVYFVCNQPSAPDHNVVRVSRNVPETPGVLRASLEALLGGPTDAERADGFSSWFSEETADVLLGVTVAEGRAVVDLDPSLPDRIPNASTSYGSAALLAELNATVFQFGTVDEVEYRLGGSCEAFFEWLQGECTIIDRADAT